MGRKERREGDTRMEVKREVEPEGEGEEGIHDGRRGSAVDF